MDTIEVLSSTFSSSSSLASCSKEPADHGSSSYIEETERKKRLVQAYQIFSDPTFEMKTVPTHDNIEQKFPLLFGGEQFITIIGSVDLATLMQDYEGHPFEDEQHDGACAKDVKRATKKERRVVELTDHLEEKLAQFGTYKTNSEDIFHSKSWRKRCLAEAEELKKVPYGVELMHCVGSVYIKRAKQYLASNKTLLGAGGWIIHAHSRYQTIGKGISIFGTAVVIQGLSAKLAKTRRGNPHRNGSPTPEEEALMCKIRQRLRYWLLQFAKIDIERVIRETCARVLEGGIMNEQAHSRALALQVLGEAYTSVRRVRTDK